MVNLYRLLAQRKDGHDHPVVGTAYIAPRAIVAGHIIEIQGNTLLCVQGGNEFGSMPRFENITLEVKR